MYYRQGVEAIYIEPKKQNVISQNLINTHYIIELLINNN